MICETLFRSNGNSKCQVTHTTTTFCSIDTMASQKATSVDDSKSMSSYASVESVVLIEKNKSSETTTTTTSPSKKAPSQHSPRTFDFSGLLKPRTVISFSAKNNALVQLSNGTDETGQPDSEQIMYELHQACFLNDVNKVKWLINKYKRAKSSQLMSDLLSVKDKHDNTPLHLACMLGHLDITKLLTSNGARVKVRNLQMWTPLNEAISFGNRDLIRVTLEKFEKEVEKIVDEAKPKVIDALTEMDDFRVEVKWDFESWIPFVSRFLPSDLCKIRKKGSKLRLDCTLCDMAGAGQDKESAANSVGASISPFRWDRGDLTFLFDIEKIGAKNSIVFMNNTKKTFLVLDKHQAAEPDLEREIDLLLAKEMIFVKLNTRQASFVPTQVGWIFNKRDKVEQLNGYLCNFFDVQHLYIVTKLRLEHLSEEELKKREETQQKIKKQLTAGFTSAAASQGGEAVASTDKPTINEDDVRGLEELEEEIEYRPSLPPPPANTHSWQEYIDAPEAQPPILGRKPKTKESRKEFKAQIAMSEEFPLSIADLNKLLDALVPLAKFRKLKEFITVKLPPGFPVKIDIPIVPAISAKVCFQNFERESNSDISLFRVPSDYKEEELSVLQQSPPPSS